MRIGVISDTHGLLRPEAATALGGADHIIHAGDIGRPEIVASLAELAPVTAIRGNVDTESWADAYPDPARLTLAGRRIVVTHDRAALGCDPTRTETDILIFGHSHRPLVEERDGVVLLNPGSAGPRRFRLPVTLALLELSGDVARAEVRDILGGGIVMRGRTRFG